MKKAVFYSLAAAMAFGLSSCDEEDPFGGSSAETEGRLAEFFVKTEGLANRLYKTVDQVMRDSLFLADDSTAINGGMARRNGANVTIDYGTGSAGSDGVIREGEITLVMTGNDFLQTGTQVAGSFNNYKEDDESVTGSFNIVNQGNNSFSTAVTNLSFGAEFSLSATKTVTWQSGFNTSNIDDDIYELTGSSNGAETATSNAMTATINEKFIYDATCSYGITQGLMDIGLTGDSLTFSSGSIDFISSDGCNNVYTVSLTNTDNASVTITKVFDGF